MACPLELVSYEWLRTKYFDGDDIIFTILGRVRSPVFRGSLEGMMDL